MSYDWSSKIREMEDGSKLSFDVKFRIPGPGIIPGSQTDGVVEAHSHKFVLVAVSPVFQAMLSAGQAGNDEIVIHQVCPEAFKTVISFIYNMDSMNFHHVNDVDKLIELYHVSNQYEILECKKKLFQRFSSLELDSTNFCQIVSLLDILSIHEEVKEVKEVLERNAVDFIHSKKDFPLMIVEKIIDSTCQTKIKEALFEELVCSLSIRNVETSIKVVESIENDERSSFMMEIIQKYETARNCQDVFLWLNTMFPVSINLSTVGEVNIIADSLGVYDRESSLTNGYPAYRQRGDKHRIRIDTEKTWSIITNQEEEKLKLQTNIRTDQIKPVSFCLWINEKKGVCQVSLSHSQDLHFIKISSYQDPSPCNITITATGRFAELAAGFLGSYVPTEEWDEGRRIFKLKMRGVDEGRLQVEWGLWWRFVWETFGRSSLSVVCVPSLCPADPRVPRNVGGCLMGFWHLSHQLTWVVQREIDGVEMFEEGGIDVSCSVHDHHDEDFEEELGRLVAAEEARMAAEVAASREMVQDTVQSDERLQQVQVSEGDIGED